MVSEDSTSSVMVLPVRKGLDECLHTATKMKNEMKSGFVLDVVVGESATVLELLSGEDEMLPIRRNALLVVFTILSIVSENSTADLECNGLASKDLDEYWHTATKMKNETKSEFFLDVVIEESATILELLSSENETLLIGRNAFLALDLGLHCIVDRVRRLDLERDSFACQGLNKDPHT